LAILEILGDIMTPIHENVEEGGAAGVFFNLFNKDAKKVFFNI